MQTPRMRIAVIAPPFFSIPPDGYGGIEAVVAMLVDGLVDRGHDVTLIAAGADATRADFVATYESPQAELLGRPLPELTHAARADRALAELRPDIVHDHTASGPAVALGRSAPSVITCHGPVTGEWGEYLQAAAGGMALVAISQFQVDKAPELPWRGVVPNALDATDLPFRTDKDDFVVWLGRMSPDKGAHLAIDISRKAGKRLVLAAKCSEPDEKHYFADQVEPRLGPGVEWLGELGGHEKYELLAAASGLVFPIDWDEPFGMVMIEAMACGTPVLALGRGSVPEIVVDGVTGFVRTRPDELVEAMGRLGELDPAACRAHVIDHFGPERMVAGYEQVYADVLADRS
jgi:glycosyltransferase involved in cell wall biosynthesis